MILIVDNSDFRRDSLVIRLRTKGYLVCGIDYKYLDSYEKPFMTVYVNPPRQEINKLKNDDTISLIFTDKTGITLPIWSINIGTLTDIEAKIIDVYKEKCPYMIKDKINIVGYICEKNKNVAVGGKIIYLSNKQSMVLNLFLFNSSKKFRLYEASSYMHFSANSEERFARIVYEINKKSKDANREKIILFEKERYFLNPDIKNYVCKEYDDTQKEFNQLTYLVLDMSYDL